MNCVFLYLDDEDDMLDLDDIGTENQWTPKAKLKETNEFILDGLKANTAYSIRVTCSNYSGWSDYSKILNFTTKPIEGGNVSIFCSLTQKKAAILMLSMICISDKVPFR